MSMLIFVVVLNRNFKEKYKQQQNFEVDKLMA